MKSLRQALLLFGFTVICVGCESEVSKQRIRLSREQAHATEVVGGHWGTMMAAVRAKGEVEYALRVELSELRKEMWLSGYVGEGGEIEVIDGETGEVRGMRAEEFLAAAEDFREWDEEPERYRAQWFGLVDGHERVMGRYFGGMVGTCGTMEELERARLRELEAVEAAVGMGISVTGSALGFGIPLAN